MDTIAIESADLHRTRRTAVRRLVTPLLPNPPGVTIERVGTSRDTYTLSVLPHGRAASYYLNPEAVLVATSIPQVLLNYYESWRELGRGDEYYLDRAYMHFHLTSGPKPIQVFSLHCDPSLKEGDVHFRYKRGPHIHVDGAKPDVSRAHISLCLMDTAKGGADLKTLMANFGEAVQMVAREIFPCWERGIGS